MHMKSQQDALTHICASGCKPEVDSNSQPKQVPNMTMLSRASPMAKFYTIKIALLGIISKMPSIARKDALL